MKVLLCNKYLYPRGGAEISLFETARLLEDSRNEVSFFSMQHPLNIKSRFASFFVSQVEYEQEMSIYRKFKTACRIIYSNEARKKIRRLIESEKPDIAHLNNIHHQLSPSIIDELHINNVPMVMTMRDFKMVCPTYNLLCNGTPCELCKGGKYYNCLFYRCTKGSYIKSAINTMEMYLHNRILQTFRKVALFIVPSKFLENKVKELGFRGKTAHLPNFVRAGDFTPAYDASENSIVYFGRLSPEKGVDTVIKAMKGLDLTLKIIGNGPQRADLEKLAFAAGNKVKFLGFLQGEDLHREIRNSLLVVVPSVWPEIFGRVVIEAFALGKPVLGARVGAIPELVVDYETGLTFEPGNPEDFQDKIHYLMDNRTLLSEMGRRGRHQVEEKFSSKKHCEKLIGIYQHLI